MADNQRFNKFVNELNKHNKVKISYKNKSFLMKLLSYILFFNKDFKTKFITTIGNTIHFPNEEHIEKNQISAIITAGHEYRHICDSKKYTNLLFSLAYLFPQILVLLIIPFVILFGWLGLIFLLLILPLPAYFRMRLELNGYTTSLFCLNLYMQEFEGSSEHRLATLKEKAKNFSDKYFNGPAYYYMWPFGVENKLINSAEKIINGDIYKESNAFNEIRAAFENSKK